MLAPEVEEEIRRLAERYGAPIRWVQKYPVKSDRDREWINKFTKRRGEVLFVVPRPESRVLVHAKGFYPSGIFRLPTGGIDPGESIENALRREALEELGQSVSDFKFQGVVENVFDAGNNTVVYPTFIFEIPLFTDPPQVNDPHEQISEFQDVDIQGLREIAKQLRRLDGDWRTWGQFRALPHELIADLRDRTEGELGIHT